MTNYNDERIRKAQEWLSKFGINIASAETHIRNLLDYIAEQHGDFQDHEIPRHSVTIETPPLSKWPPYKDWIVGGWFPGEHKLNRIHRVTRNEVEKRQHSN